MRFTSLLLLAPLLLIGCASDNSAETTTPPPKPEHPVVTVQGVDGTTFHGELLNGSVTIDCGQGQLTLLTDHIYSINFASDSDTIDSASVRVSGKVKEPLFMVKSEHGVFTLLKERLKKIDFANNQPPAAGTGATASSTATTNSTARARSATVMP